MKITRLKELIVYITAKLGPVSRLKLAKLVYLIDWSFYRQRGRPLTRAYYMRERRGPVPATFGSELEEMLDFEVAIKRGMIAVGNRHRFSPTFAEDEAGVIDEVLQKYGRRSERDLLVAAYLSKPMKALLKEERAGSVREHEGISFGRFPSEAHDRGLAEADVATTRGFSNVAPEDMTDEDTVGMMIAFYESLPLMRTAEDVLRDGRDG